jgi:DNA replication licensing factor MCM4
MPFYRGLIKEILEQGGTVFNLDTRNLRRYDHELYDWLVKYPEELIPIFDIVVDDTARDLANGEEPARRLQVRVFNLETTKPMRDLDPIDVGHLVSLEGMVTRVAPINPDLKQAFFRCSVCAKEMPVFVDKGKVDEPKQCSSCGTKHAFQLVHNRCQFSDRQAVKLQERPDEIPEGETPHTVSMLLYDSLVDQIKPGDRVEMTGVFRAVPVRESARTRVLKSTFRTYVDVVHVRKTDSSRLAEEGEETAGVKAGSKFYDSDRSRADLRKDEANMRALAAEGDIYETLTRSMAPSVFGLDDIKKGILCQLFGGTHKDLTRRGGGRRRGEVNVLLVGDPGTSKSQLLSYVHKISPRGIYTSGRGSSAVGLTAYVSKDPDTKEAVLESGALVLSDRGICCIDEFDKMSDSSRSVLHEVMEQQTVSIAKAGIICTLNARTSVLACANPVGSRYNPRMSVIENIQLPPSLLSRFDLVYLVLDKADEQSDRRLAKHLVSLHARAPPPQPKGAVSLKMLTQFVSYARAACHPKISDDAANDLVDRYVEMRQQGTSRKVISATPRQLESLVRMSEALARMRLADEVTTADVAEAVRLMKAAMKQSATDPITGAINMDLLTGHRAAESPAQAAVPEVEALA